VPAVGVARTAQKSHPVGEGLTDPPETHRRAAHRGQLNGQWHPIQPDADLLQGWILGIGLRPRGGRSFCEQQGRVARSCG
jgi:hypothetical protein